MNYLAAIAALLLGTLIGWLLRPYLVDRSEQHAQYDEIIDKLGIIQAKVEVTEHATGQIKADVDQMQRRARKRLTLFRKRLEEFLGAVYQVQAECGKRVSSVLSDERTPTEQTASRRVLTVASLYFRGELRLDALKLHSAATKFSFDALKANTDWRLYNLRTKAANTESREVITAAYQPKHEANHAALNASYSEVLRHCSALEDKATVLITKYLP